MYAQLLILLGSVPLASLVVGSVRLGVESNCSAEQMAELSPPVYLVIYGAVSLLLVAAFMANVHYVIQRRNDGVSDAMPHTQLWHISVIAFIFNLAWFIVARLSGDDAHLDCESSARDSTAVGIWRAVGVWEMILTVAAGIYLLVLAIEYCRGK